MRFVDHNIGPHRWHVDVYGRNMAELLEFKSWLQENYPNCMCKRIVNQFNGNAYYEVRGSDIGAITTIKLTWGGQ